MPIEIDLRQVIEQAGDGFGLCGGQQVEAGRRRNAWGLLIQENIGATSAARTGSSRSIPPVRSEERRAGDWSSDVCSSDLGGQQVEAGRRRNAWGLLIQENIGATSAARTGSSRSIPPV